MAYARRAIRVAATIFVSIALPAEADPADLQFPRLELWTGADVTSHAWSLYTGLTYAPFGPLGADGWRIRLVGGYGEYRYQGGPAVGGATVDGVVSFADLLAGYQARYEALTIKAFIGANADLHGLTPDDPENSVRDDAIGWKVVLEGWLDVTPSSWAALDLSYGHAHDSFSSRLRLGYRLWPELSLGIEAGAFGNAESRSGRGGAFARYEWAGGEISISAGVSGDIAEPSNPYGSVVWLTRY